MLHLLYARILDRTETFWMHSHWWFAGLNLNQIQTNKRDKCQCWIRLIRSYRFLGTAETEHFLTKVDTQVKLLQSQSMQRDLLAICKWVGRRVKSLNYCWKLKQPVVIQRIPIKLTFNKYHNNLALFTWKRTVVCINWERISLMTF